MRKVLHIHKKLQEMLCTHYMKSFYAKNYNEPQCLEVLRHIVLRELQDNDNIMNKHDKAFLDLILSNQMVAQAIHKWLSQLGEDVCLIKWCCEWINERNIWTDEHAPLGAMVKTNEVGQLPTYFTLDKKTYIHPHTHFTNEMCRMYTHLRPNDLVQIIKMRWRTDLNQINGMVYRGKSVHVNFYTARDQWMNLVRAGFERFQDDWIRKHPHVQYNYTLGTSVLPFFSLSGQENGVCSNCGMSGHGARNCAEERIKREDNGYGEEVFPPILKVGGWEVFGTIPLCGKVILILVVSTGMTMTNEKKKKKTRGFDKSGWKIITGSNKRNIHTLREEPLLPKDFRHQIMRKVLQIHKKLLCGENC